MIIVELIGQLPNRIGSCMFNCLPVSFPFNMIQIVGQYIRLLDEIRLNITKLQKKIKHKKDGKGFQSQKITNFIFFKYMKTT